MDDPHARITISLHSAAALVLFDWLMSVDFDTVPIEHPSQKQALMDLLTAIESDTTTPHASESDIAVARELVSRDMGW